MGQYSMKNNVLFISRSYVLDSPVGIRHENFIKFLNINYNLDVLNLTSQIFIYQHNNKLASLTKKILHSLPIYPDVDTLILKYYKSRINKLLKEKHYNAIGI